MPINAGISEGSLVLTDSGLVKIENVKLAHKLWDGVEWVAHGGIVSTGVQNAITIDGVTATEDQEVYQADGIYVIMLGDLDGFTQDARIAVGEVCGEPITYCGLREVSEMAPAEHARLVALSLEIQNKLQPPEFGSPPRAIDAGLRKMYGVTSVWPRGRFTVSGRIVASHLFRDFHHASQ
jgi:hypothetical protein